KQSSWLSFSSRRRSTKSRQPSSGAGLRMNRPADSLASEVSRRLALAITAGKEAGRLTLQYFQQEGLLVERKSDASPVTIADRSAEQLLRDRIAAQFPRDGILG